MIIAASSRLEAQATGDSAGVRAAALDYVEGFYEGDSTRLVRSVRPEVSKVGFSRNASTGAYARSAMPWAEFHAYANGIKSGKYRTPANAPKEYFIPVGRFDEFIPPMRSIFQRHHVNVINVSIRHARPDTATLLSWAPREVFAFVVYYKQKTDTESQRRGSVDARAHRCGAGSWRVVLPALSAPRDERAIPARISARPTILCAQAAARSHPQVQQPAVGQAT